MDFENSPNRFKVLIVGAGLSGLSAAKWLQDCGVNSYAVLEARDRVGGRTFTKKDPNVQHVDLGAAYIGPSQNYVLRLAKELGVDTYKVNDAGKVVYFRENGGRKLHFADELPKFWNPLVYLDLNHLYRTIDELGREIPCDCPWKAPHAQEWDNMTVREFGEKYLFSTFAGSLDGTEKKFINKICTYENAAKDYLQSLCTAFIANDAYESSLLWFLWYIKNCQGTKRMMSNTDGAEERKCLGGTQQLSIKLAATLKGEVVLNKPVCSIDQSEKSVLLTTLDGTKYQAEYVILAIPPAVHMKIHFTPPLPPLRNQLIQRTPMGSVWKVFMYYEDSFWRKKGMSGTFLLVGGDDYPVVSTLDDTKPDGSFPAIVGFVTGDKARKLSEKTQQERKALIAKSYSIIFNCPEALKPIHYEEYNWMAEQYSGGGYTAVYPPGSFTMYGKAIREPIHRVYLAGTETSIVWSGYMDGAIAAGERAAREVLHAMGKICKDEIWRKEPESKDIPALPMETSFLERHLPSASGFLKSVSYGTVLVAFMSSLFIYSKRFRLLQFNY